MRVKMTSKIFRMIIVVYLHAKGTNQRWEVVANFVNQHTKTPEIRRHAKETLSKAKELQSGDFHLSQMKEETNKRAYENLEKQKKRDVKVGLTIRRIHICFVLSTIPLPFPSRFQGRKAFGGFHKVRPRSRGEGSVGKAG